jgi:hypothetical protein
LPWHCKVVLLGAVSIIIGILWDISWHRTIGRDTFWTPAHLAIHLGGLLGGLTSGWLVLRTTFRGTPAEKGAAVRLWGLHGPLGAWVSIWGAIAMLTSAPFDDWWHSAYGLDVKILSPPHMVLAVGMWAIVLGALLLILREQNLAPVASEAPGRRLFLLAAGILLAMGATVLIEESWPNHQHSALFYKLSALTYPAYLLGFARASRFRWAATIMGAIYMGIFLAMLWILPLFPGEPKLGPVYNRVDHFVPLAFPLLLVAPGFVIDCLRHRIGEGRGWRRDLFLLGSVALAFVLVFGLVQWMFSSFMLTEHAENWFFAADRHWAYSENVGEWRNQFWWPLTWEMGWAVLLRHAAVTLGLAGFSAWIGLCLGNWMARVKR